MAAGIELAPLVTKLKVDTEQFKRDMKNAAKLGKSEADSVEKSLSGLTRTGQTLGKVGSVLTKSVTLPIVGVGVATTKMAVDFESSFAKVSTLLDDGVVDFSEYKDSLISGSNETKVAVDEYSESVYQAISAGVDQTKAVEFTTEAMKLAKGGFTSGASAVDILTTAINGYNLSAEDATKLSDMLITTQNLGKTTVNELSSSMGKVIPIASSVNFGMNELSASYAQLTKNGIATAEAGTYLKQMLSELGKTGSTSDKALRELTGKGFAELKKEGVATSDILNMMSQYAEKNGMTLKDMFGSVEAGSAALVLAKGNGQEYNGMLDAMNKSAGATQSAFDKMDATPAEQLKGALNKLRNEGIKFGASFIPVITKVSEVLSKAELKTMTDELNRNLNEGFFPLTSDINGIFKHPNGLMLQWGIYPSTAMTRNDDVGGYIKEISFKEAFIGSPQVFTTCHYWGGNTQTGTQNVSSNSVTLYSKSAAADLGVRWLALGSWK